MGGRTLYCATTKLLSVVRGYLQSNTRLVSGEALPCLLLRAALQLQNGQVATAQGSGQHHVALGRQSGTIDRAIAPRSRECSKDTPKARRIKKWASVSVLSGVSKGAYLRCNERDRPSCRKQDLDHVHCLSRGITHTLVITKPELQDFVKLNKKFVQEASRRTTRRASLRASWRPLPDNRPLRRTAVYQAPQQDRRRRLRSSKR
jgi:hypothetical protein